VHRRLDKKVVSGIAGVRGTLGVQCGILEEDAIHTYHMPSLIVQNAKRTLHAIMEIGSFLLAQDAPFLW